MESKFIQQLFSVCANHEDKTAIVDRNGDRQTTYKQLFTLACQVAAYINEKGIVPQSFIGIRMSDCMEFMAAEIGVWLSRCAAVPMGVKFPQSRVDFIMQHSESALLITEETMDEIRGMTPINIINLPETTDNALLIYTSGSTGNPKGILHTFESIDAAFPHIKLEVAKASAEETFASMSPFYFIAIVMAYDFLRVGATVHIFSEEAKSNVEKLEQYILDKGITIAYIAPAMLKIFNNKSDSLKAVLTGSEKLTTQHSKDGYTLCHLYGMTETECVVMAFEMPQYEMKNVPIGRCMLEHRIVDEDGNEAATESEGELLLKGVFCKEYFKDPEQTAQLYQDGWLHTGDIVREDSNGLLYYVNRKDWMVKVNGQRVEPGEVEAAMLKAQGVVGAIVKGFDNGDGSQYLCAYYITNDETVDSEHIKAFLESKLPPYMIPSFFVKMDKFPVNANGKTDRKSLQAPDKSEMASAYVAPTNDTERMLCEAFAEVLGLDRIGINDDFFALGGDSIRVMKLMQHCKDLALSSRLIFAKRTPKAIAADIDTEMELSSEWAKATESPLSQTQLGIYLECQKREGEAVYNNPFLHRFSQKIDFARLSKAIGQAVGAHPALNATITANSKGIPVMKLAEWDAPACTVENMSEQELEALKPQLQQPFNLKTDRLFRIRLIETEKAQYIFSDFHHIIFDGTSMHIFLSDVDKAYRGENIEAEPFTGFSVALKEEEVRNSDVYQQAKEWYLSTFSDIEQFSLPERDLHETETSFGVHSIILDISQKEIEAYCTRNNVTANTLTTAAFGFLLNAYTRDEAVAFSTIYNGRQDLNTSRTISMLVKTLPVLCRITKGLSVKDYIATIKQQTLGAMANDIFSFAELSSALGFSGDISFAYQADMHTMPEIDGIALEAEKLDFNATGEPISVQILAEKDNLRFEVQYHSNRYSEKFVKQFANCYNHVLNEMMHIEMLDEISLLDEQQQNEVMALGRGKDLDYDQSKTFIDSFLEHVAQRPEATAVVFNGETYTYAQLDQISNAIAAKLMADGVKPDEFVCIMLPRCKEFVAAVIGIMKAGAAYVPVDKDYPEDRKQYMIENSEAKVVVTEDFFNDLPTDAPAINLTKPEGRAYMIFTSGSTGKPKGVVVSHHALGAFLAWRISEIGITPESRHAQHASFSFDASLDDLLCPIAAGGSVYIMNDELRKDLDGMYDYFQENKITGLTLSTAIGMAMLWKYSDLPVRFLMMGGEKMLHFPKTDVKIINGYGPTEFCVCSSFHIVGQDKDTDIPIGRAVPNTYSLICDSRGHLLPQGMIGELCLAGPQMADGYWHRSDLTAEKFNTINVGGKKIKVYHTGDLARYNDDGELEYFGRIDNQVKLRGFRIEMGEIENQIKSYPGILHVCALVKSINGSQHLCAYYTATEKIDVEALKEHISAKLTDYMVPDAYMQLDEMPLTPNGKVNRKVLPEPKITSGAAYVEPEGPTETAIAEGFAQMLGLDEKVGALDSFFSLGGDSIKAIRLVSFLRQQGIEVQVSQIMKHKTVRAIASVVSIAEESHINQDDWTGEVDNSAIVDFFFRLAMPEPNHFHQSVALESAPLDMTLLRKSFDLIVKHHDMLRAIVKDGKMFVRPVGDNLYRIFEFEASDAETIKEKCYEIKASFDIENEGMMRVAVFHLGDKDLTVITIHHLVVDGISWRILQEDLENIYAALKEGKTPTLPLKTNSYKEYVAALDIFRNNYIGEKQKKYWTEIREKIQKLSLCDGDDYKRVFENYQMTVPAQTTAALIHSCSEAYHTEINDLLLTAFARAYRRLKKEDSFAIQMEGHGREQFCDDLQIDRTIGWFTSAYPCLIEDIGGDLRHDIRSVKEMLRHIPEKGFGYGPLMGLDIKGQAPVGFNYLGEMDAEQNSDSIFRSSAYDTGADFSPRNTFGASLSVNGMTRNGMMTFFLSYDTAAFSADDIQQLSDAFNEEIEYIVNHCTGKKDSEYTATDLGETEWSEDEFQKVMNAFGKRDEHVLRIYPLTPMQEGMLLKHVSEPESPAYRLVSAFDFDTLPTEQQLRSVLEKLGQKHEVLRTAIIHKDVVTARQAIIGNRKLFLQMADVSQCDDKDAAIAEIRNDLLKNHFDLQDKPLFGLVCAKTGENSSVLIVAQHHAIIDGWCLPIILGDIVDFLMEENGLCKAPSVMPVAGTYENYVRTISDKDKDASLEYWDNLLADYNTKAIIPVATKVNDENRSDSDEMTIPLPAEKTNQILALCQTEQITINTVVELAFGILLGRYNYSNDAVFGKVVSGRDKADSDVGSIIGLFINSIPVRVKVGKGMSVSEALHQQQEQSAASNQHDFCSLSEIQARTEMGTGLAPIVIAFENYPTNDDSGKPYHLKPCITREERFDDFGFTAFIDNDGQLCIHCTFNENLYTARQIQDFVRHLQNIMMGFVANVNGKISDLPFLDADEIKHIVNMSKGDEISFDKDKTFIDRFLEQVAQQPDATAVVFNDEKYTYGELDQISNAIAAKLMAADVKPDDFVCIMLPRCKEFVAAVVGIMKAGAAYVPVDKDYPEDRKQYMIENSEAKVVVTEDFFNDLPSDAPAVNLTTPDGHAYMIFTSGSTGKPKGVVMQHIGITTCAAWLLPEFGLQPGKKNLHHPSFSFDASTFDLFYPLMAGAAIHILDEVMRKDLDAISIYIKENGITGMTTSTALGMALLNQQDVALDYIMLGGEKFMPVKKSTTRLYNGYGPTEFCVCSSFHIVDQEKDTDIPIGRATPNSYSFVCDSQGNVLPQGMTGELCLAGQQMAKCYWRREDLTAEKFSMIKVGGKKIKVYHTGDFARWNENGEMDFLGRIDSQVKLRGFRIELGEIENQIKSYPGILQVCALVKTVSGSQHLCAYFTATEKTDVEALKKHVSAKLTDYMVPTVFAQIDKMPLTPNGKIDKKVLTALEVEVAGLENEQPKTTREAILLSIAHKLLGRNDFGVTDGLRELGLDSLTAIKFAGNAKKRDILLKVGDILSYNTIRKISEKMMSVASWFKPYEAGKSIIVLFSGIFPVKDNLPRLEILSKKHNILLFEPIDEHYDYIFKGGETYHDIIEFYYSLIDFNLFDKLDDVAAFGGFCMGGFMAYSMTELYQQYSGVRAKVFLGDSISSYAEAREQLSEAENFENTVKEMEEVMRPSKPDDMSENAFMEELKVQARIMMHKFDVAALTVDGCAQGKTDLDVLLFNCTEGKPVDLLPDQWREITGDLTVVNIPDSHMPFCMDPASKHLNMVCEAIENFIEG